MKTTLLFLFFLLTTALAAQIRFSNVISNNIVLQRAPESANLWGWATAGDSIRLTFNGQIHTTTAGSDGSWLVTLPPTKEGGPYNISVTGTNSGSVSISNVLFGDVYVCGGQSNMLFTLNMGNNNTAEIADAANYPQIRLLTVGMGNTSKVPLEQLGKLIEPWAVPSAATAGTDDYFSAVCFFYAKNLAKKYPNLPFGLISTNWGGTIVQAWSGPNALRQCSITDADTARYVQQRNLQADCNQNSLLWNAMTVPFLKFSIKGALWYQGESNLGQPDVYKCIFPAMITDWRKNFAGGKEFPFLFVQLAPWIAGSDTQVPDTRQAQLAALQLPNVGFVTAVDLGDPNAPRGSVHPRNKQEVGLRLSRVGLTQIYGETGLNYLSPLLKGVTYQTTSNSVTYTVTFTLQSGDSLVQKAGSCTSGVAADNCQNFAVNVGNTWAAVSASNVAITGTDTLRVTHPLQSGQTARGLRYGYASWPVCTIFNSGGLPAVPFSYTH